MNDILFFVSNRSETTLLEPIFKELKLDFKVAGIYVKENIEENLGNVYTIAWEKIIEFQPKLVCCAFDRPEMVACALACFYHNTPFFQIQAGDTGDLTHDEIGRKLISLMARYRFCVGEKERNNLISMGLKDNFIVGTTLLDDFQEVDINKLLDKYNLPQFYDVVLIHPDTSSRENTINDANTVCRLIGDDVIIFNPNKDMYHEEITKIYDKVPHKRYDNIEKNEFLTICRHATRLIGNSSSFSLISKTYGVIFIRVGNRNKFRECFGDSGAGKRIAEKLEELISKK